MASRDSGSSLARGAAALALLALGGLTVLRDRLLRPPQPPWQDELGYERSEVLPISVDDHGRPYLDALAHGGVIRVRFDTAGVHGLRLSPSALRRAAAGVVDPGAVNATHAPRAAEVRLLGDVFTGEGAPADAGSPGDGRFGSDLIGRRRFTLDCRRRRMAVSWSELPRGAAAGTRLALVSSRSHPGHVLARVTVNGRRVLAAFDTGRIVTVLAPGSWAGAPEASRPARVALGVGPLSFEVDATVESPSGEGDPELPEPVAAWIGSDVLSRIVFTVDYRQRLLALSP